MPKTLYIVGLGIQGALAPYLAPLQFLFLWGIQHWLVSVALGAHMAESGRQEPADGSRWYRWWDRFNRSFFRTAVLLAVISLALTPLFEFAVHPDAMSQRPSLKRIFAPLLSERWIAKTLIALNFATVFIHFVMDRGIFRFSNPAVRKVSIPLLFRP